MIKTILLFFLFNLTNQVAGQKIYAVDTLMKQKKVKAKTQYECDENGKNCKILHQRQFDLNGQLIENIEFSAGKPFLTAYYHYNKFNKIDSVYRQFAGQKKYVSEVFKFDNMGNLIEYQTCIESPGCSTNEKYLYDNDNNLITKIEFREGVPDTRYDYIYDTKGNNIKVITKYLSYSNERSKLNFYNESHQVIKSKSYDENNNAIDSSEYSYDKNGNLISLNWMGGLGTKSFYTYDTDGNEIEYRSVSFENQISDQRVMTYKNKLVQTRIHYEGKIVKYFFKFDYLFH